jgi:hypothetical protein
MMIRRIRQLHRSRAAEKRHHKIQDHDPRPMKLQPRRHCALEAVKALARRSGFADRLVAKMIIDL